MKQGQRAEQSVIGGLGLQLTITPHRAERQQEFLEESTKKKHDAETQKTLLTSSRTLVVRAHVYAPDVSVNDVLRALQVVGHSDDVGEGVGVGG
jgi:hypothetical protein